MFISILDKSAFPLPLRLNSALSSLGKPKRPLAFKITEGAKITGESVKLENWRDSMVRLPPLITSLSMDELGCFAISRTSARIGPIDSSKCGRLFAFPETKFANILFMMYSSLGK